MAEFGYQIKIPKERIAILIGKNGQVKREIEELTKTKLVIDSKEGDVSVKGEDALLLYSTREIIKAIGRGFNPETASLLIKQDYAFEIITLPEFDKKNHLTRIKGRIIGSEGKTRRIIEEMTECYVSVYGKTVSIVGRTDTLHIARKAIDMILKGSPHSTVYRMLERMYRETKRREYEDKPSEYLIKDNE
ncbi:RNA-processing protein [archaeon]|jgi:ribosomal RNA assembly protein|nr:RNA-processing protein [archaeon]MBT4022903.1 RNA-processing protein [archaeon]MBT4272550.1 RNA-processing protein [archaeon]MBT4460382.1 RNA-processing protein [archaeon]MBT4859013.1 RNA-processing protein [archaeon]